MTRHPFAEAIKAARSADEKRIRAQIEQECAEALRCVLSDRIMSVHRDHALRTLAGLIQRQHQAEFGSADTVSLFGRLARQTLGEHRDVRSVANLAFAEVAR